MTFKDAIALIKTERNRQDEKWGELTAPVSAEKSVTVLAEELGGYASEVNSGNKHLAREKLVQIAAVAVKYLENMDKMESLHLDYKYRDWTGADVPRKECMGCDGTGLIMIPPRYTGTSSWVKCCCGAGES